MNKFFVKKQLRGGYKIYRITFKTLDGKEVPVKKKLMRKNLTLREVNNLLFLWQK